MLQRAEEDSPLQLGLLNDELNNIFGKPKSLFLKTSPKSVLFSGVPFCVNVNGIGEIICNVVKGREVNTLKPEEDGSVRFAFFDFVSF